MSAVAKLPIFTRDVVERDGVVARSLHVFCPQLDASVGLERCNVCPRCTGFDLGAELGARPAVLCSGCEGPPRPAGERPVGTVIARHSVCVRADAPLEALDAVADLEPLGVPVVDEAMALVGVVTSFSRTAPHAPWPRRPFAADAAIRAHAAVTEQLPISSALVKMASARARRLPVLARDGTVVGFVDDIDAMRALTTA